MRLKIAKKKKKSRLTPFKISLFSFRLEKKNEKNEKRQFLNVRTCNVSAPTTWLTVPNRIYLKLKKKKQIPHEYESLDEVQHFRYLTAYFSMQREKIH